MADGEPEKSRRNTPFSGVRIVTNGESDDEGDDAASAAVRAESSARAAFSLIREVQRETRVAIERDQRDHERIYQTLNVMTDSVREVQTHVGNLREAMGEVSGKISTLTSIVDDERQARREAERIRLASEAEIATKRKVAEIDQSSDKEKERLRIAYKAAGVIVTVLGTLITAYATGSLHC